eukprot:3712968-Pyramimonas_sp.AAC.2
MELMDIQLKSPLTYTAFFIVEGMFADFVRLGRGPGEEEARLLLQYAEYCAALNDEEQLSRIASKARAELVKEGGAWGAAAPLRRIVQARATQLR